MNTLPEGWTDDMRIAIDPRRIEALVSFLIDGNVNFTDWKSMHKRLMQDFGLSESDAYLALDRVPGGMVRAVTGNPDNRPDPIKDPLAHMSFQRIWFELPKLHIFSRRRNSQGKWSAWFEEGQRRLRELKQNPITEQVGEGNGERPRS